MITTITVTKTFTARHAVPGDPRFSEPHEREWALKIGVAGPIVEPGWVMPFEELSEILDLVVPASGNLNDLASSGTSEAIARCFWQLVEANLPDPEIDLVLLDLTEADDRTVKLRRSHE